MSNLACNYLIDAEASTPDRLVRAKGSTFELTLDPSALRCSVCATVLILLDHRRLSTLEEPAAAT